MSTKYYCIFDFVKFKWVNPLKTPLGDYAIKYSHFQVERDTYQTSPAKVEFTICSHGPDKIMTRNLSRTSERFYGDENFFQMDHQLGCRRWRSWVADLAQKHVRIWYHFPWYNRTKPVSWLSSDLLICFHVIQPILEYKLQELGVAVLHAAGAAKDNQALLLPGRGGVRKTTILMNLLKNGWGYLADDLVLLHRGKLYPNPQSPALFDYLFRNREDEHYTARDYPKLLWHLWASRKVSYPIAGPTDLAGVVTLLRSSEPAESITKEAGLIDAAAIEKIVAIDRLERLNRVDYDDAMGRFMLQLNQTQGLDTWGLYWQKHRQLLTENLTGLSHRELTIGPRVSSQDVSLFEQMI